MDTQIQWNIRVPLRDGVTVSADVYRPKADGQYPAILLRTPYGKATDIIAANGRYYASHGYAVVYMDVRGRGDSEGEFVPYRNEGEDGSDCVEWVAAQPWCDGNVGLLGGSYLARSQWLTALEQPPHLKCMISVVSPSDPFVEWPTGVPTPHHLCWMFLTDGRVQQNMGALDWHAIYEHLPLYTMNELTGRDLPYWREELQHPYLDEWWKKICYQDKYDQIDLPVLHISGWYDDEQVGTPLNYVGMTRNGASEYARQNQKLLMGPWGHRVNTTSKLGEIEFGEDALIDLNGYQLRFFDRYLKDVANGLDEEANVRIFVMGDNKWRDEADWPLPQTQWQRLYLHSKGHANSRLGDGKLSTKLPNLEAGQADVDQYEYDPSNPYPFITDGTSAQIGGPDDYAELQLRDDVLIYTTDTLTENVEVTGPIRAELFAATSAVDTDFMVKLLDVHPNGLVQRLTDGMVRARFREGMEHPSLIEPDRVYRYEVDCWTTSHVFKKGHQIRVEITSSAFPKYDRNLNTGAALGMTADMVVAKQTIFHDSEHPSAIILPIIPR